MTHVWLIGFLSTFVGIGAGGILASLINGFKRSVGTIYAICTGLILGLISFEIVPEAIQLGNWTIFFLGFLAGVILFELIHIGIRRNPNLIQSRKRHNIRMGLFLALIISIHNFPVGVVLGTSEHSKFSLALLQALILHNIPEGMILFTPIFIAGIRIYLLFLLSVFIAAPVALGALIGEMIGMQNNLLWSFLISLTIGTIYMVTIKEILPESIRQSSNMYSFFISLIAFSLMGVYLIYL
ncbi:ZIP family metal transporter [Sporosarcina luteola]|uniref:ZIP family metal transporter n=1 Tax=Sporosarcina luteola TaxID=582850 RepID=UPI0020407B87|nr:ZIP family metal transporter [Sporosarcina luteola]MCM3638188.1 ZIP family metal transporter [Sporosarcina luteola]